MENGTRKVTRIVSIILAIALIMAGLYIARILPLPIVIIRDYDDFSFGGLITCYRLEHTEWHTVYSSGEYVSSTPIYGIEHPQIDMSMVWPYCPRFTPSSDH